MNLIESLERQYEANSDIENFRIGDTVRVDVRIIEGKRERVQAFQGTVISMRHGGANANFTVRRVASHGIGVERTFFFKSPRVEKVAITRRAQVHRAKLYYLRERSGKAARLRERRFH